MQNILQNMILSILISQITILHILLYQQHRTIETRNFEHFDEQKFLDGLENVPWENVEACTNIDEPYQLWKSIFMGVCDKHCPIVSKACEKNIHPMNWSRNKRTNKTEALVS